METEQNEQKALKNETRRMYSYRNWRETETEGLRNGEIIAKDGTRITKKKIQNHALKWHEYVNRMLTEWLAEKTRTEKREEHFEKHTYEKSNEKKP